MPQYCLGGLDAEVFANVRCRGVTELVRVPANWALALAMLGGKSVLVAFSSPLATRSEKPRLAKEPGG